MLPPPRVIVPTDSEVNDPEFAEITPEKLPLTVFIRFLEVSNTAVPKI